MDEKSKVEFLENYVEWSNDRKLFPPTHSPTEYAEHLRNLRHSEIIEKALRFVNDYEQSTQGWSQEMVADLARILRDEKE